MPKKSSKGSPKKARPQSRSHAWQYSVFVVAVVILALSSYLAEAFGDNERSLGPKLFYYQTAALARPFSSRLHTKIATIYDQTGRFIEAVHELSSFPRTENTRLQRAQILIHERHFPEASNALKGLHQKDPTVAALHAWADFGMGKISSAQKQLATLQSGEVSNSLRQDCNLLGVLLALPDPAKASGLLRPDEPQAKDIKAWIDQAATYDNPASKGLLTAELYRSLSLTRPALTTVNSVISTSPNYVPAIELRFEINQELGQTGAAQEDLKKLQELNPTHKY